MFRRFGNVSHCGVAIGRGGCGPRRVGRRFPTKLGPRRQAMRFKTARSPRVRRHPAMAYSFIEHPTYSFSGTALLSGAIGTAIGAMQANARGRLQRRAPPLAHPVRTGCWTRLFGSVCAVFGAVGFGVAPPDHEAVRRRRTSRCRRERRHLSRRGHSNASWNCAKDALVAAGDPGGSRVDERRAPAGEHVADGRCSRRCATQAAAEDVIVPVHLKLGNSAVDVVLGIAAKIDTLEQAVDAYLNEIPGWHLTGDFDKTPAYSAEIDGSLVLSAGGAGVGLRVADRDGGHRRGRRRLLRDEHSSRRPRSDGRPLGQRQRDRLVQPCHGRVELRRFGLVDRLCQGLCLRDGLAAQGRGLRPRQRQRRRRHRRQSGLGSATISVVGSVGADVQVDSLFGGWTTIASTSKNRRGSAGRRSTSER